MLDLLLTNPTVVVSEEFFIYSHRAFCLVSRLDVVSLGFQLRQLSAGLLRHNKEKIVRKKFFVLNETTIFQPRVLLTQFFS